MGSSFVVAGAAQPGIGEAVTRKIVESGNKVIGTYSHDEAENARALTEEFLDLVSLREVDPISLESLAEFSRSITDELCGIVCAQMLFYLEDPQKFDLELWDKSIRANLSGPNLLIQLLQPKLKPASSIVVITSAEAFSGSYGASAYSASKAAMHNLVKTHANNLGYRGIRVNAVAPGWIGGVMNDDKIFNMSRDITPLGRLGTPEEVANAVEFLLSEKSSFITGTTLAVDGGYTGADIVSKYEMEAGKTTS